MYDILTGFDWGRTNVTYGFNPNLSSELQHSFNEIASEITLNSRLTLTRSASPDILIGFGDTEGFLGLAYFPGDFPISGDILLSPDLSRQPELYQEFVAWHEFGHALNPEHEEDRQDSVMAINLEGLGVEDLPTSFTNYDWWALDTTYYHVL
ncbi:hypothetical protein [Okeania sp. SIO2B3]|uniref:hypothetical protein n=1 Tax=Okeania sp. SIO2B3 TaxID=2607784 RepID=UPI0013C24944|nr:hypothetical protein [Okeania sp. SIO2B3]NET40585.1 hypothetical protein [Okeania sp. SIO2B3]